MAWKKTSDFLLQVVTLYLFILQAWASDTCGLLSAPRNGDMTCTRGSRRDSVCRTTCLPGFASPSPPVRYCACFSGRCVWAGQPVTCKEATCPTPDNVNGRVRVLERWPSGFAGMIEFTSLPANVTRGWAVILVFESPLAQDVEFMSWSTRMVAVSPSRNSFTLTDAGFNADLSSRKFKSNLRTTFVVENAGPTLPQRGYAAMYYRQISDATCHAPTVLPVMTAILPSVRTTGASTTTIATSIGVTTTSTPTKPPTAPTDPPTSTTTTSVAITTATSTEEASMTTPNDAEVYDNVTKGTGLNETVSTTPSPLVLMQQVEGRHCKSQGNSSYRTRRGWSDKGMSYFSGNAKVKVGSMTSNWMVAIVFAVPITSIQVWNTRVIGNESEGKIWKVGAQSWNVQLPEGSLDISFIAELATYSDRNPAANVYLCSLDFVSGDPIHGVDEHAVSQPVNQEEENEEDAGEESSQPTAPMKELRPSNTTRCNSPVNGRLPPTPGQTRPKWKPSTDNTSYDYNEMLHKSILFYEAQRAGKIPRRYNRIPWRGDSTLRDGCGIGVDLSGGWFDAGDTVKFTFPMASAVTNLAWGGIAFRQAYKDSGTLPRFLASLRWAVMYLMRAHFSRYELVVMVGSPKSDHAFWGRPEELNTQRPVYKIDSNKPGSEVAAETAAALAASSIVFKQTHPLLAAAAIRHAEGLYDFADKYRGDYHISVPEVRTYYASYSGHDDERLWAAAWLYKATNKEKYLTKARDIYTEMRGKYLSESEMSWDRKVISAQILLANITGEDIFRDPVVRYMRNVKKIATTPQGVMWLSVWSPNRYAANAAMMAVMASELQPPLPLRENYLSWARRQIHLLAGDSGRSWVIGVGRGYPKKPHHRASSCPLPPASCSHTQLHSPSPNPIILYGALVGGPNKSGRYEDNRNNYRQSEVAVDYNAGYQTAVAGLKYIAIRNRNS